MPPRFLIFFGLCALQAISLTATAGELVRIRLIKNLTEFPQIQNAQVQKINDRLWILKGSKLIFQNKKLSGQNLIVKNSKQKFDVVGQFDFDRYLAGVVASEMPTKWPMEALNTQAIVARSFALARINERQNQRSNGSGVSGA
jgi:stage II sporulation protein D